MMDKPEVKFPGAEKYPNWLIPVALACGLPLFVAFWYFTDDLVWGFAASLSASSITIVTVTLWDFRNYLTFWIITIVNILIHGLIIYNIPNGLNAHFPGIIFTPVFIADFLIWQFITVSAVRIFRV